MFGLGADEQKAGEEGNLVRGSYIIFSPIFIYIVPHSLFYKSSCLEMKEGKYNQSTVSVLLGFEGGRFGILFLSNYNLKGKFSLYKILFMSISLT